MLSQLRRVVAMEWNVIGLQGAALEAALQPAAKLLQDKQVVAFPTETVYGLGGDATSDDAVRRIFEAKGRPSDNPLIVHVADMEMMRYLAEVPPVAEKLASHFWPGPLTLVVRSTGKVSQLCSAGQESIGIRMPQHEVALALIRVSKVPIAAPSANLSGKPSPTTAAHVRSDLIQRISGLIDGGSTGVGVESTVVDCTGPPDTVTILRPGGVTKEQLSAFVKNVIYDPALKDPAEKPKAPGMKYAHYAPTAPLFVVERGVTHIQELVAQALKEGKSVGVLATEETRDSYSGATKVAVCGSREQPETVARELYSALRSFDSVSGLDVIYAEPFSTSGIGMAIMNRLTKAAAGRVIA